MLTGKKIILFGAGIIGRRALNHFGSEKIHCFADNKKAGQTFWDKPVISFAELKEIHWNYNVVLSANLELSSDMGQQCEINGIPYSSFYKLVSCDDFMSNPVIREFKGKHKGERCFLIGTGPSLTAEDLSKLHAYGEVCFACNSISNIFEQTQWRPDYYIVSSPVFFAEGEREVVANTEAGYKFIPELADIYPQDETAIRELLEKNKSRIIYYRMLAEGHTTDAPRFSTDVSKAIYFSSTTIYAMIQLAVYMGFEGIYLLGVDGTTYMPTNPDEFFSEKRHFYEDNKERILKHSREFSLLSPEISEIRIDSAYRTAKEYTQKYGVKIFNATRGGKVEVFERASFDSLFLKG